MSEATLKKFKAWLLENGSVIHENTNNEYEVLRFSTPEGVGVLYKDKRGSISSGVRGADAAYSAFHSGKKWSAAQPTKRRTYGSHRKLLAIVERDGLDCIYCGTTIPLEIATREHFVALSRGGPDTPENTVIACKDCNMAVGSMTVKQKIEYALSKRLKSGDSNGKEN